MDELRMDVIGQNGDGLHYELIEPGTKHDTGKPAFDLIPPLAEQELARVLEFGARKYSPDNWRRVPDLRQRYTGAALRHINAMRRGELRDPESGLLHAAHALACLAFIAEVTLEGDL